MERPESVRQALSSGGALLLHAYARVLSATEQVDARCGSTEQESDRRLYSAKVQIYSALRISSRPARLRTRQERQRRVHQHAVSDTQALPADEATALACARNSVKTWSCMKRGKGWCGVSSPAGAAPGTWHRRHLDTILQEGACKVFVAVQPLFDV